MSTDIESQTSTETRTPPPDTQERVLQAIATQAARLGLPQLQYNADYLGAIQGLPFSSTPYKTLSRKELGLGPSSFYDQFDTNRRANILANLPRVTDAPPGVDIANTPLTQRRALLGLPPSFVTTQVQHGWQNKPEEEQERIRQALIDRQIGIPVHQDLARSELEAEQTAIRSYQAGSRPANVGDINTGALTAEQYRALSEVRQEELAQQQYIKQAEQRYGQVGQTPLAQLTQRQIQQELGILPLRQEAETAQLRQNVQQSQLAERYQREVAPSQLQLAGQEAQLGLQRFGQLTPQETAAAQQGLSTATAIGPTQADAVLTGLRGAAALTPSQLQAIQLGMGASGALLPEQTLATARYLGNTQAAAEQAFGQEAALRGDLTDLVTSGRAASPAQQAIIDKIYGNRLSSLEQDLARQYERSTAMLPEIATARGMNVTSADMPDRYALARSEYLRQAGQGALGLSAEAAGQSLNYPLQLGNLNVQGQYLTNQQIGRVPGAIGQIPGALAGLYQGAGSVPGSINALYGGSTLNPASSLYPAIQASMALRQGQPQYFPGYQSEAGMFGASSGQNAYGPFSVPLGLQGSVIGGSPFAVNAQNPFLQSRLSNTNQSGTSTQSTGGFIPGLGAGTSIMQGTGNLVQGLGTGWAGFTG